MTPEGGGPAGHSRAAGAAAEEPEVRTGVTGYSGGIGGRGERNCSVAKFNVLKACADDLALLLRDYSQLAVLSAIMADVKWFSCMALNMKKCVITPAEEITAQLVQAIRRWLAQVLPHWSDVRIEARAKYLGFWLGTRVM